MTQQINIDVMQNNGTRHYKSLKYPFCSLWKFDKSDLKRLIKWLTDRLPSLKTRRDMVIFLRFPDGHEQECRLI